MNIRRVEMYNFLLHKKSIVDFPENGLVVITGQNGHGKSTVIDAVYYALTGKSLRGTPVMNYTETTCAVKLFADNIEIHRKEKGQSKSLTWNVPGQDPVEYETRTKANNAIANIVDPEMWLRLSVFYSDMLAFGDSTDTARKQFLEKVLGIEHYDAAYRLCLKDITSLSAAITKDNQDMAVYMERVSNYHEMLSSLSVVGDLPPEAESTIFDLQNQYNILRDELSELRAASADFMSTWQKAQQKLSDAKAELNGMRANLRNLSNGSCPTCGQSIPDEMVEFHKHQIIQKEYDSAELATQAAKAKAEIDAAKKAAADREAEIRDAMSRISLDQRELRSKINAAAENKNKISVFQRQLDDAQDKLMEVMGRLSGMESKLAVLEAASSILSPKGFRAKILGSALEGIASSANRVLAKLGGSAEGTMKISLNPFTENKNGSVTDAIALIIEGAGGGHGYRALSQGQRRRIDVSLLLAPAMLSNSSTLFMDEVFDSLDASGTERVVEVLSELSEDRCVVVITHRKELFDNMKNVAKEMYVAENGGMIRM